MLCWRCAQYFVLYIIYVVASRVGSGLIYRGTSVRLWCFLRSAGFTIMYSRGSWRRGTLRSGLLRVAAVHHCGHGCSRRGQRTIPLQLGRASGGERGKAPLRRKLKLKRVKAKSQTNIVPTLPELSGGWRHCRPQREFARAFLGCCISLLGWATTSSAQVCPSSAWRCDEALLPVNTRGRG